MAYAGKKQGVISGSMMFKGKEFVEIFDHQYKYLYGEVDDLFIAYGAWVEYNVVDAPPDHPRNCFRMAVNIDQEVKQSKAPTTDQFGKKLMNVREFNKVDFFQYVPEGRQLTHKSAIQRDFTTDNYYNNYYGEVSMARDSRNRLIEHQINSLDVMLNLIASDRYVGHGPHWEVTHFINQGKQYSINGYLSIRGFVLRGPGGVVRNRRDVVIPPDALRPINYNGAPQPRRRATPPVAGSFSAAASTASWDDEVQEKPEKAPSRGLGSFGGTGFGAVKPREEQKPQGFGGFEGAINVSLETVEERPARSARSLGFAKPKNPMASNSDVQRFSGFANAGFASSFGKMDSTPGAYDKAPARVAVSPPSMGSVESAGSGFGGSGRAREVPRSFGSSVAAPEPPRSFGGSSGAAGERVESFGGFTEPPRSFGGAGASEKPVGSFGPRFGGTETSGASSGSFGATNGSRAGFGASGTSSPAPRSFGGTSGPTTTPGAGFGASGTSSPAPRSFGGAAPSGATSGPTTTPGAGSEALGPISASFAGRGIPPGVPRSFGGPATATTPGAGLGASQTSSPARRSFGGTSGAATTPGTGYGGCGASAAIPRSFGAPSNNAPARSHGLTFGNRASVLDNSVSDFETPRLANQTQDSTWYPEPEPNNNKLANLFDDSWGDEEDIQTPVLAPPPRSRGFGLPPQAKGGLAKYNGNQRF